MLVDGKHFRTIWDNDGVVSLIDQRWLPHDFRIETIRTVEDMATAIRDMHIRGAGAIGAAAGYGMYLAATTLSSSDLRKSIQAGAELLNAARPTAVNLSYAVKRQLRILSDTPDNELASAALNEARAIADEDAAACKLIGHHGGKLLEILSSGKNGQTVNVLTHCNAGWLAFVDYGTATAPIYEAFDRGIDIHVWVDETRPRNQGSRLTAWELGQHGVPHTIIADNTGGHLMQHGLVDAVIVGTDRTTRSGYVANKIGTYLKALAAHDTGVPFYVALPSSTIDWEISNGLLEIPIEQRGPEEIRYATGELEGKTQSVLVAPAKSPAANYAFDVTPPRLVTSLISERGVFEANEEAILAMYPEMC